MLYKAIQKSNREIVLSLSPGPAHIDRAWQYCGVPQSVGNTCVGRNVDSRIGKASFVQLAFRRRALRAVCFGV